ncbi:putative S-phase kinase-associated protein 1 [Blattamonas nauphoetae]|uniref:S-phase kinase-associated protein 1 n=1 Tax=Blattamonas nauphoetae TaxID=2049346 RepID=A0ABQ9XH62_9EUKA|nr:putative S-phase kinase-associated protein 1 [Blattamonas nauphoetae]KAK2950776.1 putative S-phase kinase-associated protein 1 [Blattamonas nauphoetae]
MSETLTLVSADGKTLTAPKDAIMRSAMLKNLLEVAANSDEQIPLDFVHSEDLENIIEYCKYHVEAEGKASEGDISKWDGEFINRVTQDDQKHLRLIQTTDQLQIEGLFKLLVQGIVRKLHNKTPEQIREKWNIPDDLPKEKKDEIFNTTNWLYKKSQ